MSLLDLTKDAAALEDLMIAAVDPETGAHGMRNNFVKLVKAS